MAETLTSAVFLMAMGVWLGGVVFFSFFTAPVIFERLPRSTAADLIAVIFPRYYKMGYVCGGAMLIAGAYPISLDSTSGWAWSSEGLVFLAFILSLYAGQVVMPRVRRLRMTAESSAGSPEHTKNREAYDRAHQWSVTLNTLVLLLLVAQTLFYGYRIRYEFLG